MNEWFAACIKTFFRAHAFGEPTLAAHDGRAVVLLLYLLGLGHVLVLGMFMSVRVEH